MGLPMPFQYFHIMNMMLCLNLFLWAYSLGCQDSYWGIFIYMCVQGMFQGLRELSTGLSDPYGTDEVDFPVNDWMRSLFKRTWGILENPALVADFDIEGCRAMKDPEFARKKINMLVDVSNEETPYPEVFGEKKALMLAQKKKGSVPATSLAADRDHIKLEVELQLRRESWSHRALPSPEELKARLNKIRKPQLPNWKGREMSERLMV